MYILGLQAKKGEDPSATEENRMLRIELSVQAGRQVNLCVCWAIALFCFIFPRPTSAATITVGGTISVNTRWTADNQYVVTSALTIAANSVLTIDPGTTVMLNNGVSMTMNGALRAEGATNAPILFTRSAGGSRWGGITINGGAGSSETRITWTRIEFNGSTAIHSSGGTVFLDHLTFGTFDQQYISLDSSSFIVSNCHFPSPTTAIEPAHGTGGIKAGGHGIFLRNYFGTTIGYSDVIDFTGGNRPGGPIVQFVNNVFTGSSDDILDLDGTDAWVEGNIFMHAHKNGSPDTSSGVSGGNDSTRTSEVTILGNIFYDCDQAATAKQGNFFTLLNNTIVHQTHAGGSDTDGAVIGVEDDNVAEAVGMYLEGNIIFDAEKLVRNRTNAIVTFTNNIMPFSWTGPGAGNSISDPLFRHVPSVSETHFTNWTEAQIMRDWLSLFPNSPAKLTGPNATDKGAGKPLGATISGAPTGATEQRSATITVGLNAVSHGIPVAGWPNGSGFTHYKWRLDTNAWSAEIPIATSFTLSDLTDGPHHVEVIGKNDASFYQNDPLFGDDATITGSGTWFVTHLALVSDQPTPSNFMMHFNASAGQTYTVEYRDAFDGGHPWSKLTDIPAQPASGDYSISDPFGGNSARFYRVVSPQQ